MALGQHAQLVGRATHGLQFLACFGDVLGHDLVEQADEDVFFVAEVEVDGAVGDPGAARDLGHLGRKVALAGEHLDGRAEDP